MPLSKSINPPELRRPGGHGRRTGEFKDGAHNRVPKPKWDGAKGRVAVEAMRQPVWEIQPLEPPKAYEAFKVYRELGPLFRTQDKVVEIMVSRDPNFRRHLEEWSAKWEWVARCRAFDAWLDTIFLAQKEAELRAGTQRWLARIEDVRETEFSMAMALAEKVREMIQHPVTKVTRRKESKDGKTIYLTIVEPARWDWRAVGEVLSRLSNVARLSAEMVTDGARAATPDPTGRATSDVDAWLQELGVKAGRADG